MEIDPHEINLHVLIGSVWHLSKGFKGVQEQKVLLAEENSLSSSSDSASYKTDVSISAEC